MSRVLTISPDAELRQAVQDSLRSISGCEYVGIDRWTADYEEVVDAAPSVILAHMGVNSFARSFVLPLVETFANKSQPIPSIVISNAYDGLLYRDLLASSAKDCLTRPLDKRRLAYLIDSVLLASRVAPTPFKRAAEATSGSYQSVFQRAMQVAGRNVPVLLTGETGVGKTFMARQIHESSPRAKRPFVALNCGAIAENLAESELFGHRKGAFTGATEDYEGHLAAASDGTLFLDDIDLLTPAVQAKLLRVLDDRIYEPVGSVKEQRFESRLITATNRSIEQVVAEGTFRRDLMYRLRVVELKIPPLRERREEFRQLTMCFIRQLCELEQTAILNLSEETWTLLELHDWPGNLRELRNALEYAITFTRDGILRPNNLPPLGSPETSRSGSSVMTGSGTRVEKQTTSKSVSSLKEMRLLDERQRILDVLSRCNFNKTQTARELGISRNGLYKRLRVLGL